MICKIFAKFKANFAKDDMKNVEKIQKQKLMHATLGWKKKTPANNPLTRTEFIAKQATIQQNAAFFRLKNCIQDTVTDIT